MHSCLRLFTIGYVIASALFAVASVHADSSKPLSRAPQACSRPWCQSVKVQCLESEQLEAECTAGHRACAHLRNCTISLSRDSCSALGIKSRMYLVSELESKSCAYRSGNWKQDSEARMSCCVLKHELRHLEQSWCEGIPKSCNEADAHIADTSCFREAALVACGRRNFNLNLCREFCFRYWGQAKFWQFNQCLCKKEKESSPIPCKECRADCLKNVVLPRNCILPVDKDGLPQGQNKLENEACSFAEKKFCPTD